MRRGLRAVRRLRLTDWGWLQFKAVLVGWAVNLLLFPPPQSAAALGSAFATVASVVLVGSVLSATGLFSSRQPGRAEVLGLTVEVIGLFFVVAGIVSYWLTQVFIITASSGEEATQRFAFAWFTYAMGAAVVARLLIILEARHAVAVGKSRRIA